MNKPAGHFLLALVLLVCCMAGMAQTNISGFISANTTWNLAGSPYIVTGNALVSHGYTLTIEPGVVVKFDTDKALQIDGELIAVGTAANRITFTSNQINPGAGDWAKLHFADICVDAVFDISGQYVSGCIMKYCDVLYGGGLGFGELHIENSNPYFNNCHIMYSSSAGIYSSGSVYLLESSAVEECAGYGLCYFSLPATGNLYIHGDTISNNAYAGIGFFSTYQNSRTKRIINNYFSSNTSEGAIYFHSALDNVVIQENYFVNNMNGAGVITATNFSNDTIMCNRFVNNQSRGGVIFANSSANHSSSVIFNNIFDGNSSFTNGNSVMTINCKDATEPTYIFNNVIVNNLSQTGICCQITPRLDDTQFLKIYNNEFINNTALSVLRLDGYVTSNSNLNFLLLDSNNFNDPNAGYEFYNNIPYGLPNIYASNNYWGSSSTQHVDSVMYDYFDFANQSVVYYSPILTSPVQIDTKCSDLQTAINNIEVSHFDFSIYPNPASNYFTVAFDKLVEKGLVEIYNLLGEKILERSIYHSSKEEINLPETANGIYLVKISAAEKQFSQRIIIQQD